MNEDLQNVLVNQCFIEQHLLDPIMLDDPSSSTDEYVADTLFNAYEGEVEDSADIAKLVCEQIADTLNERLVELQSPFRITLDQVDDSLRWLFDGMLPKLQDLFGE